MTRFLVAVILCEAFFAVALAQPASEVTMRVVDLAGGRIYLDAGESAGIHVGTEVTIGEATFRVEATTRSSCVVPLGDADVTVGASASAIAVPPEQRAVEVLRADAAASLDAAARLPAPTRPSSRQTPEYVPLGVTGGERRARFLLASTTSAYLPLDGSAALIRQQLRARVHAEPLRDLPFTVDADATLQLYAARDLADRQGGASRPVLNVQRLELGYGREQALFVGLGRLASAARGVGMLDGVRVRAPSVRGLTLSAFGGLVPRLFDNLPSLDAARFGVEANVRATGHALRPELDVVVQGSFFDGRVDERRISAFGSLTPASGRLGVYGVLDVHDRDNPWKAARSELSAAGTSVSFRRRGIEAGLRFDFRRPDRSRFLASQLPTAWLCGGIASGDGSPTASPAIPTTCVTRGDGRYFVAGDIRARVGRRVVFAGGGSFVTTPAAQVAQGGGFLQVRVAGLGETGRVLVTPSVRSGSLWTTYAIALEGGASMLDGLLDLTIHYRPAYSLYVAEIEPGFDHLVGADVRIDPGHSVAAGVTLDAFVGHDVRAVLAQCTVAYRPGIR